MSKPRPTIEDPGVVIEAHHGQCPVQIEGTVDGLPFYLRMREGVSFSVAEEEGADPVGVIWGDTKGWFCDCFTHPHIGDPVDEAVPANANAYPGWASAETALKVLALCVSVYREREAV